MDESDQPGDHFRPPEADVTAERAALLDVLIVEHRQRAKDCRERLTTIYTTLGAMTTGLLALTAIVAARLDYNHISIAATILFGISAVGVFGVVIWWVDAVGGPVKSVFKPYREAVAETTRVYDSARGSLDPIETRQALLERLLAEEKLAERRLRPAEENLSNAPYLAAWALLFLMIALTVYLA
jgi:hypothetical protein